MRRDIVVIAHNLRSCHNVGSLLRTCEGLGIEHVYLTGYTPYPRLNNDKRLPHIIDKLSKQIDKTSLGSEKTLPWSQSDNIETILESLKSDDYSVCALEQTKDSLPIQFYMPSNKIAVIIGREVEGIEPEVLKSADVCIEIPMLGSKESFNVVQAAAMALYHCRFSPIQPEA